MQRQKQVLHVSERTGSFRIASALVSRYRPQTVKIWESMEQQDS
jgi:hypothetical protein